MTRKLLHSLLLAAVLGQGWAQASMPLADDQMSQQDCAGQMAGHDDRDCCPEGVSDPAACHALCAGGVALTAAPVPLAVASGPAPHAAIAQPRAGPSYIPLNPPPIA